ncbi:hypothetical protein ACTFIV_007403 [Dictyostelium citrinum]
MEIFQIPLDTLVVDQDNIKEIQCGICLQILVTPRQCKNGHLYCLGCIQQSLKKNRHECPQCRCSLDLDKLSRSLFLEKHLRNLNVFCKNHFKIEDFPTLFGSLNHSNKNLAPTWVEDLEGCTFIGPHENIESHEISCQFRFENCKFSVNNNNINSNSNSKNNNNNNINNISGISVNSFNLMTSSLNNSIHGNCSGFNGSNNSSGSNSPLVRVNQKDTNSKSNLVGNLNNEEDELLTTTEGNSGEDHNNNSNNANNNSFSSSDIKPTECSKIRFKDLEKHYLVCPFRPIQCNFCKSEFSFHSIKDHENNCDFRLVECNQCKSQVPKKELNYHLNEKCPNQIISCTFGYCDKTFERKELNNHLNEALAQHMIMMKQQQQDEINLLKKEFSSQLQLKDEKIKGLEKLIKEKLSEPKIKIDWKIKNYLECKRNGYHQSEKFIIEGFPFFIGIFTDGDNNESKGYISIYLFLDTSDIPKGRCINTEFSLKFNNQRDPLQSLNREYKATFPIRDGSGWGDRRSIKTHSLESNGYIKDNTLLITAEVTIKKILWLVEESQCDKH